MHDYNIISFKRRTCNTSQHISVGMVNCLLKFLLKLYCRCGEGNSSATGWHDTFVPSSARTAFLAAWNWSQLCKVPCARDLAMTLGKCCALRMRGLQSSSCWAARFDARPPKPSLVLHRTHGHFQSVFFRRIWTFTTLIPVVEKQASHCSFEAYICHLSIDPRS